MDPNTAYDIDDIGPKGKYYKVVKSNGKVHLEPVKVPGYILEERKRNVKKREMARSVKRNREQSARLNLKSVLFLSGVLCIGCLVCFFYLRTQNELLSRRNRVADMKAQVEELSADNDILEGRMASTDNLLTIKKKASENMGMSLPKKKQIRYYSLSSPDNVIKFSVTEKKS